MRRVVFADTAFYIALLNASDSLHGRAESLAKECSSIVTSQFVLLELANFMCGGPTRPRVVPFMHRMVFSTRTRVVPVSARLFAEGLRLYAKRSDKQWSLVDCTSFVVMNRFGIREALTADHHFEQAGFEALLKSP